VVRAIWTTEYATYDPRFRKDFRRIDRRGYDLTRLAAIIDAPRAGSPLFSLRPCIGKAFVTRFFI